MRGWCVDIAVALGFGEIVGLIAWISGLDIDTAEAVAVLFALLAFLPILRHARRTPVSFDT